MIIFKKSFALSVVVGSMLLFAGCEEANETVEKVTKDVAEAIQVDATKDNEYLLSVKNGSFTDYPNHPLGEAFENYFSSPKWKYFEADSGEHVVEFTGYCTYMEAKVKATLQFTVEEDGGKFEVGALDFNGVPQTELIKFALVESIFDETPESTEDSSVAAQDTNSAAGSDAAFERVMSSFLVELDTDEIGNIFNEHLFEGPTWSSGNNTDYVFSGNYKGEIVEGEPSFLELTFEESPSGDYTIASLKYNGDEVSGDGFDYIVELLHFATSE